MASRGPEPPAAGSGAISFALDALKQDDDGRVELTGRWYGVRGRRFVRPSLTLALKSGGIERRALADLAHKPWAAEDGEPWTAAFPLGVALGDANEVELSVAPDISVPVSPEAIGKAGRPKSRGASSTGSREPRIRTTPRARPAAADRGHELERLRTRLDAAEAAHERERGRREAAERALEDERTEALKLRSEVGRLGVELDLARTARDELETAASDLETTRNQARDTGRELEAARAEAQHIARQLKEVRSSASNNRRALENARSETVQHERRLHDARHQLEETGRERDEAIFAFEQERAESERLRRELADAEASIRRLAGGSSASMSTSRSQFGEAGPQDAVHSGGAETQPLSRPNPAEHRLEPMSPRLRALNKLEGSTPPWADRPLNPSLQAPGNWMIRGLAVIVVVIVVVAVIVVINSTVA